MSWSFSHSNINNNNPRLPVAKLLIRSLSLTAALVTSGILTSPIMASAATTIQTNSTGSSAVSTGTVRTALDKTGTVLPTSATTQQQADTPTGLKVATGGSELTIPKDAKSGITLASLGIKVSLPNANTATTGQTVANGVVAYGGTNGSANAVQANPDGSIRMLNVISNATAPTDYTYTVTLPQGTTLRAETTGGISILDAKGQIVAVVDVPWAKDAKGTPIQTSYNVKGNVITQHIAHNVKGVVYPVTADPSISWGSNMYINLSKSETNRIKQYQQAGYAGWGLAGVMCGGAPAPANIVCAAFAQLKNAQLAYAVQRATDTNSCLQIAVPYWTLNNPQNAVWYSWAGWYRC